MRKLDGKFHIDNEQIVKTSNGQIIPEEEPVFLFRARDYLALPVLQHYKKLCQEDHCTEYQLEALEGAIKKFEDFILKHPDRMKQPGITKGL